LAECERLLIQGVTPRMRADTLRKKLRKHQQDYLTYIEWEDLIRRLVGTHGMTARPRPMTAEGMVEWACDIMYALLDADGYVGTTDGVKRFHDRDTDNIVRIISRQGVMNVNVVITNTGGSGSMAILHATACVFESVRLIVRDWEKWKAGNKGAR
jgi:hypothetical protein